MSQVFRTAIEVEHAKHTNPIPLACVVHVPAGITKFFASGAIYGQGLDGQLPASVADQTRNVVSNLLAALNEAGMGAENLVLLKFMANGQESLEALKKVLKEIYPDLCKLGYPANDSADRRIGRSSKIDFEVATTWPDRLVYCEATAVG